MTDNQAGGLMVHGYQGCCEDYDDVRCGAEGTEWYEGRWLCNRHAEKRRGDSARRQGVIP